MEGNRKSRNGVAQAHRICESKGISQQKEGGGARQEKNAQYGEGCIPATDVQRTIHSADLAVNGDAERFCERGSKCRRDNRIGGKSEASGFIIIIPPAN